MADATEARVRRPWRAPVRWVLGLVGALVFAVLVAVWAIDTTPGHRFLVDRIARLSPATGLKIRIGRIEGSIWTQVRVRDLRLSDPQGVFLQANAVDLDWRPLAWLHNTLDIRDLRADLVILSKSPKLRATGRDRPILPGFDIRIDTLRIAHLRLEPALAGRRQIARVAGTIDIHRGRALVRLDGRAEAGDTVALRLDAEPDRDRFDIGAQIRGPIGGAVAGLLGSRKPIAFSVTGDGRWHDWRGAGQLAVGPARIVDLALGARSGRYTLAGTAALGSVAAGKLQRLSAPRVAISGSATLADRRLVTRFSARSAALLLTGDGVVDLAKSGFDPLKLDARLLAPRALFPNMTGNAIRLAATLRGPFATAAFDYAATADRLAFDNTGFERVHATGKGRLSRAPVAVPIKLTAARVTGVGSVAGGILANLGVDGVLKVTPRLLTGQGLVLRSDKLGGKLSLLVDLVTGRYDVSLTGGLQRYLIPGIGIVDVTSEVSVVPGPNGIGTRVLGIGKAIVRRFDNAFLRGLAGGLPQIDTRFERLQDGSIRFTGLHLRAPTADITGQALRRRDGSFLFEGGGTQGQYGPFRMVLDGDISHPRIALILAHPVDALGLANVDLKLDPTAQGFSYTAAGGSRLGPFTSHGAILLPASQPAMVAIVDLAISGTHANGNLRSDPGGFTGKLAVTGGGIDGALLFNPVGMIQRVEAHLAANRASFEGPPAIAVVKGQLDAVALLDPAGTSIDATVTARGLKRGGLSLARLDATAKLRGGVGRVSANLAGSRGRAFEIRTVADVAPDRYSFSGEGMIDRRQIRLTSPATLIRVGDGWQLGATALAFEGGSATVSGRFGASTTQLDAQLSRLPLSVLDIGYPGLGLGGVASGTVGYAQTGTAPPSGRANLSIRGLTRSGLVLSSQPVDLGLAAVLDARGAATRMIVSSNGQVIGRGQARLAPLATSGDIADRLAAAPMFGQFRYTGPADTLWRLTGVELIDLSGPIAIGADVGGTLASPVIRGSVQTAKLRLESSVTGTVIDNLALRGRFDGSRLLIDQLAGTTRDNGSVSGRAAFDFAAANGFGIDIAIQADKAVLLNADDIGATVTGPVTIRSDGSGGVIGGDVDIIRGRFKLGTAAAANEVPHLNVREINRPADEAPDTGPAAPWNLAMHARARNRIAVTGLGLDSEWRADLQLKGQVDNPSITGTADLVRGGYEFAGRRFDLDRGQIRFTGEVPADPTLDITALADITGLNASIRVTGTGQKPDIAFTSIPALPEDELLSRLLFGTSITNLSAPEALQLAAAVASLRTGGGGGGGLNPINAVRKAAGLDRLRILPADTATGQRTTVAAGKYLTRRVYIEVATDGQGYSATRVEWELTRWLSVLSSISTLGRTSANIRISKDY